MGEVHPEDWKEVNNLLVGNGNHSKGVGTERPRTLILVME